MRTCSTLDRSFTFWGICQLMCDWWCLCLLSCFCSRAGELHCWGSVRNNCTFVTHLQIRNRCTWTKTWRYWWEEIHYSAVHCFTGAQQPTQMLHKLSKLWFVSENPFVWINEEERLLWDKQMIWAWPVVQQKVPSFCTAIFYWVFKKECLTTASERKLLQFSGINPTFHECCPPKSHTVHCLDMDSSDIMTYNTVCTEHHPNQFEQHRVSN